VETRESEYSRQSSKKGDEDEEESLESNLKRFAKYGESYQEYHRLGFTRESPALQYYIWGIIILNYYLFIYHIQNLRVSFH
jgi:hypothetical protein